MTVLASAYCATYGRPPSLLGEAVASFLQQDYANKELIVLNDLPEQTIHIDAPGVRVINAYPRYSTLGEKFRAAVDACRGQVLFPWEDDDIYFPWRMSYSIEHMTEAGIYHTGKAWWLRGPFDPVMCANIHHCNLAMTAGRYHECGGYESEDVPDLDRRLFKRLDVQSQSGDIPDKDVHYIYRWGTTDSYHGSGWGGDIDDACARAGDYVQAKIKQGLIPTGDVHIVPRWTRDWVAFVREHGVFK